MSKTFKLDNVEYCIVRNPYTNGPMIARVDGLPIENRKEICRRFLRLHGWTDEMMPNKVITNTLEREINKILNGEGNIPAPRLENTLSKSGGSYQPRERSLSYRVINEKVDLTEHVSKFIKVYSSDKNGRYLSYDHVRRAFLSLRKDVSQRDLLTLHLYAYLASWGMLRNSFLMQKDYKFLTPIVDILCKAKYESLIDYDPFNDVGTSNARLIMELVDEIRNYFYGKTYYEEGNSEPKTIDNVTDTLVTKIILGTIGCTVAYDTYVVKGLGNHNLTKKVGIKSLMELKSFAKANESEIKEILSNLNNLYTPMKVIDMYFFEEGFTL